MSVQSFKNKATEDIACGRVTKAALRLLPKMLHRKAQIKITRIDSASSLQDLKELKGNRLEALKGDRADQHSIRINDQYRLCFRWKDNNASDVEIVDYHK